MSLRGSAATVAIPFSLPRDPHASLGMTLYKHMLIQLFLLLIIAIIALRLYAKLRAREINGRQFLLWLIIWLAAALVVIWPDITVWIANRVGVGRGSDLVIYLAIIFLFYTIFRLLLRLEKMEKNLTELVRQEALKNFNDQNDQDDK